MPKSFAFIIFAFTLSVFASACGVFPLVSVDPNAVVASPSSVSEFSVSLTSGDSFACPCSTIALSSDSSSVMLSSQSVRLCPGNPLVVPMEFSVPSNAVSGEQFSVPLLVSDSKESRSYSSKVFVEDFVPPKIEDGVSLTGRVVSAVESNFAEILGLLVLVFSVFALTKR